MKRATCEKRASATSPTNRRIHAHLTETQASVREIAIALGLSHSTSHAGVAALCAAGLAEVVWIGRRPLSKGLATYVYAATGRTIPVTGKGAAKPPPPPEVPRERPPTIVQRALASRPALATVWCHTSSEMNASVCARMSDVQTA